MTRQSEGVVVGDEIVVLLQGWVLSFVVLAFAELGREDGKSQNRWTLPSRVPSWRQVFVRCARRSGFVVEESLRIIPGAVYGSAAKRASMSL